MTRIRADLSVCEGIGMCEAQAHEYFTVTDDDQVELLQETVADGDLGLVKVAIESCPVFALKLIE